MIIMKNYLLHSLVIITILFTQACTSTEIVTANSTPAVQSTEQIPYELLMDIGILPLNPNLGQANEQDSKNMVIPDVRKAESRFMAYQLKDTLELTGNWGAVRVVPNDQQAMDVLVSGKILQSHGEELQLQVIARDATGRAWFNKKYENKASKYSYRKTTRARIDPFQAIYNRIANDLLETMQEFTPEERARIRLVNELRFARRMSQDAFEGHLSNDGKGNYTMGVREQTIFPEVDLDNVEHVVGMSITLVTSAPDDEQGRALLELLGMPLRSAAA